MAPAARRIILMSCYCLVVGIAATIVSAQTASQPTGVTILNDMGAGHNFKPTEVEDPKTKEKVPAGSIEQVEGKVGPAQKFTFKEGMSGGYIGRWVVADEKWDKAAGLAFWVKGDGSDSWGGLELIDGNDYSLRYGYCFPIDSRDWKKITVPWRDLVPILAGPLVNADGGYKPSSFRNFWFGKWFYWRDYPACSFAIDEIALEDKIELDTKDYTPDKPGLSRFLAKLKEGKPVTIVTMGDSLTDKKHWANQQKDWNEELVKKIEAKYKSKVTLVNPAIGGTTLSQNIITMPRWLKQTPQPDLVTVCFGFNDWDSKVRKARYKEYLNLAVDRIRRMTGGSADILLITTCPAHGRWETMNELCQASCEVAKDRKTGFADIATAFHKAGSADEALKKEYWAWDKTHLGGAGHDVVAQTVMAAVESEGLGDLKTAADAYWAKSEPAVQMPEGQTLLSSFEPGQENLVGITGGEVVKEHATTGQHALRVTSTEKDYSAISIQDGVGLGLVRANTRILVDVFNPQDKEITLGASVRDPQSKDYNTRYNGSLTIKPGKSTIDFDYTKLPRSGTEKADKPELVDVKQITLIVFFLSPHGTEKPVTVFFDNVRLASGSAEAPKPTPAPSPAAAPAANPAAELDPMAKEVLASWEEGEKSVVDTDKGVPVTEHATDGKRSLKLDNDNKGFSTISITDPATLAKLSKYLVLKIDMFNPQDFPVRMGCRVDDAKSVSYGTRYNDDGIVIRPGKSTFVLNLTGLTKSNARNFDQRDRVDINTIKLVSMFIFDQGKSLTLYLDNIRLEGSGLPKVAGLRAFDLGPSGSSVYPGFEGCSDKMTYTDERGFGVVNPDMGYLYWIPDSLGSDAVAAGEFRVKLPDGKYEVNFVTDGWGLWHQLPHFAWRKISLNGKTVIDEKTSPDEFFTKQMLAHEDEEDLPGQDLWDKFIAPRQVIHRFEAEVTGGMLKLELKSDAAWGRLLSFLVVYPDAQKEQGRKWMETLASKRKAAFNEMIVVTGPKPAAAPFKAGDEGKQASLLLFAGHPEEDVTVTTVPTAAATKLTIEAAAGERESAVLGLHAIRDVQGVTVEVGAFKGADGKTLAASVQVRRVRNFLKRSGGTGADILPYILQDFKSMALGRGTSRAVWLTVTVPADAAAGTYTADVTVTGAGQKRVLPLELKVYPFVLDKVTDITISCTGATAGHWRAFYPEYEKKWWEMAEVMMKNLADHGMNAVTGGPGAQLKGIKDGQAEIDYTDMDRWLALAVKHGLTMPGDSYQGLDIWGIPADGSKDQVANLEEAAKKQYGVSYAELIRIVYQDVEKHAKDKGWPRRSYSFVDEPRVEYGNIEPTAQTIKTRVAASPQTLFSGYYSTGEGRNAYYSIMPITIAHVNAEGLKIAKAAGKQIWEYNGDRSRENIGRWCFVAARAGMTGFLRNGYMYVCSQPYWDFSDDEGSWACVYPSKNGIADTVGWERTSQGVNDYRYLSMCTKLIAKAQAAGKAPDLAAAAQKYLDNTLAGISVDNRDAAKLSPAQYDEFRRTLAGHITALSKSLKE